jgi:hypothetical protein
MPVRLSRPAIASAVLLVAALAAAVVLTGAHNATAQVPSQTVVVSNIEVVLSNGHFAFPAGSGAADGTLGAACTGAQPRRGPNIPIGVVTELTSTSTRLRVLNQSGQAINGTVFVNCTLELEATAANRVSSAFRSA